MTEYYMKFPVIFHYEDIYMINNLIKLTEGGMRKKLVAVKEALEKGIKEVVITSGQYDKPISAVLNMMERVKQ